MNGTYNYTSILDNRVKTLYVTTEGTKKEEFNEFVEKITNNELLYTTQGVSGLGMGQIIGESQVPASDAPIQGFTKTFTQQIFTQRMRLSKRAYYYLFQAKDKAKIDANIKKQISNLKNSITDLKNFYIQSIIAQGFGTSFSFTPINNLVTASAVNVATIGADGVAYWSAAHPREDGGPAWTNICVSGTINPLFSYTSLLAARSQHSQKKDARGLPIGGYLDKLICLKDSQTHFLAVSIKKTLEAGKYPSVALAAGGANLNLVAPTSLVDSASTAAFEVVPLGNYGSTGMTSIMWFMFDSSKVTDEIGFLMIESMTPEITQVTDDLGNGDYVSTITTYVEFGANDTRFWMASNGTLV